MKHITTLLFLFVFSFVKLFAQSVCAMQVLSKIEKKVKTFGTLATSYRRGCQTTLRCYNRKEMVVNGQRKAF